MLFGLSALENRGCKMQIPVKFPLHRRWSNLSGLGIIMLGVKGRGLEIKSGTGYDLARGILIRQCISRLLHDLQNETKRQLTTAVYNTSAEFNWLRKFGEDLVRTLEEVHILKSYVERYDKRRDLLAS